MGSISKRSTRVMSDREQALNCWTRVELVTDGEGGSEVENCMRTPSEAEGGKAGHFVRGELFEGRSNDPQPRAI